MESLVKLVPCSTNEYALSWCRRNHIDFYKKAPQRYAVYQRPPVSRSFLDRELLGIVFREGGVWCFVPHEQAIKMNWYFGQTRSDAISGFLRATNREVPGNE